MKRTSLGELEELILLIIGVIKDDAYGVTVTQMLKRKQAALLISVPFTPHSSALRKKGL